MDYHKDERTDAVFCSYFNTFMDPDDMEICGNFCDNEDDSLTTTEHPKTQEGMTCRDCAMCEELEQDTWYCAQYGSLMDDDNMQPCLHFIFDSELKKEMFQDGNPEQET